jgi:hypothetical protein
MSENTVIPEAPKIEQISPADQTNLRKWIEYFKHLSPRTKVYSHLNKEDMYAMFRDLHKYTLDYIKKKYESEKLPDWPDEKTVMIIVIWDSSLPGQPKEFLAKNTRIFCLGDFAFGPEYFELDMLYDEESPTMDVIEQYDTCSLTDYSDDDLLWSHVAKLLRDSIQEHEEFCTAPPPPSD